MAIFWTLTIGWTAWLRANGGEVAMANGLGMVDLAIVK